MGGLLGWWPYDQWPFGSGLMTRIPQLSFTASNWHDNEQKEKDPDVRESHLLCPFDGVRPFIRFNLLRLHHDTTILMWEMQ